MLRHTVNGYVANEVMKSGYPKAKGDDNAAQMFKSEFNLSRNFMKLIGLVEMVGAVFLFMSAFGNKFIRMGTILLNIVLGGAIFKHFKAGHGYQGSKSAMKLFGLNVLSFYETVRKK